MVQYLGRRTDGISMGKNTTDTIGFYGTSPVAQQSVTHIGTTVISQVATSGKWAFSTSTAAKALISLAQSLQTKLHNLGIVVKT